MRVYLDHNGTTPIRREVRELYLSLLDSELGNPSAVHAPGRRARAVIDQARERVAGALGVREDGVVFTSGGTEANNTALLGVFADRSEGSLLISAVEHSSVRQAAEALERRGVAVARAAVDREGRVIVEEVARLAAAPDCRLVSVMTANNEVGTVMPMARIGVALERGGANRPLWHTDAVQALGRVPLELSEWGVDLASFSAHKRGGPLGVGFLVLQSARARTGAAPLLFGGDQESGWRAGTENVPAIGAAALAVELAVGEREECATRLRELLDELWSGLSSLHSGIRLCGPPHDALDRLPNTLTLLLDGVDGHAIVARLDLEGVAASVGSACSSGALEPSHVLQAMGFSVNEARRGLRLSLGRDTTLEDIHIAVETLRRTLRRA